MGTIFDDIGSLFSSGGGGSDGISSANSALSDHNNTINAGGAALAGFGLSVYQTERAGQFAKDARSWQEGLANTAYQRSMLDMRQAGLNPMLAYKQGGATTPGGAMASPANFGGIVENAMKAKRLNSEIQAVNATTKEKSAGAKKLKTAAVVDKKMGHKLDQETKTSAAQMRWLDTQEKLAQANVPGAHLERDMDRSGFGKVMRYIKRFSNSVQGLGNEGTGIKSLITAPSR